MQEQTFGMVRLSVDYNVAEIILNQPQKLNVLNEQGLDDLNRAFAAARDAQPRALLLHGEGRAFCAGRDVSAVDPATDDVAGYLTGRFVPLMTAIREFPAPTFAAVQGACLGVGLGLVIACDVVYVATDAKFGSPFANLGAILDSGGHALFVQRLGTHRTLDLIYTGALINGADAVAAGLFSQAMPATDLLEFSRSTVTKVAAGPTQAFLASKHIVKRIEDELPGLNDVVTAENQEQANLSATHDYREGFLAFQHKQAPRFTGH